jgi:hypothetical protein
VTPSICFAWSRPSNENHPIDDPTPCAQHDALGEPPFVERLALGPFSWHQEHHGERRAS